LSEDDTAVNLARQMILDADVTRQIFKTLRIHYANKETDVKYILNLLEATILNAITERDLFFTLLNSVLRSTKALETYERDREHGITQLQDKIRNVENETKTLKEKGVEDIVKKFLGGNQ